MRETLILIGGGFGEKGRPFPYGVLRRHQAISGRTTLTQQSARAEWFDGNLDGNPTIVRTAENVFNFLALSSF